jgi:predicted TIM-barrel fold metal-dependent hydrolase
MRCDSHVHIVGPPDRYPQVAERTYLADVATLKQLERVSAARAIRRFVIVQPSFYGTDNSMLLESLEVLAGRGRGVAVINPETTSARILSGMATQGVRGLRVNLYSPLRESASLATRFEAVAGLAHDLSWHIEVIAPIKLLSENASLLRNARVPVVIDHYGLFAGTGPHQPEGIALLELIAQAHVWMKLSAPYRVSADPLATSANPAWLDAILKVAPDRCVWGSDWPHTPPHEQHQGGGVVSPHRRLRYETLLDAFTNAIASEELAERILSDNPSRLYGFHDAH